MTAIMRCKYGWSWRKPTWHGSYHHLGMDAEGLRHRLEAIRLNPYLPEAWFARGSAYYLMRDFDKALSDV